MEKQMASILIYQAPNLYEYPGVRLSGLRRFTDEARQVHRLFPSSRLQIREAFPCSRFLVFCQANKALLDILVPFKI